MAAKLDKTNVPGIFRRHREGCPRTGRCECSYVIVYLAHGRQRTEPHRTLAEAREAKRTSESAVASGEYQERARVTLHEYAREWVDRYQGTGRRGFREETRDEYRRLLDAYALKYFPPGLRLSELTPDGRGLHRVARRAPLAASRDALRQGNPERARSALGVSGDRPTGRAHPAQPGG